MNDGTYRALKGVAIVSGLLVVATSIYQCSGERQPGDLAYLEGNTLFEDGAYERALGRYERALTLAPDHEHARFGRALSLMQLKRHDDAFKAFAKVIEQQPEFAAAFANRGILYDRLARYDEALADYRHALEIDANLGDGPHWLTRFLRNQAKKPPGIAERASYIAGELEKPVDERLLRVPALDAKQRPYKQ